MSAPDDTLHAIASDELAGVSGAHYTGPEQAKAQVGSHDRCAYVAEHLRQLGATDADLKRQPVILRSSSFTNTDLKERLLMENQFHCRNQTDNH